MSENETLQLYVVDARNTNKDLIAEICKLLSDHFPESSVEIRVLSDNGYAEQASKAGVYHIPAIVNQLPSKAAKVISDHSDIPGLNKLMKRLASG